MQPVFEKLLSQSDSYEKIVRIFLHQLHNVGCVVLCLNLGALQCYLLNKNYTFQETNKLEKFIKVYKNLLIDLNICVEAKHCLDQTLYTQ